MANPKRNSYLSWQDYLKTVAPTQILSERGANLVVINLGDDSSFSVRKFQFELWVLSSKVYGF